MNLKRVFPLIAALALLSLSACGPKAVERLPADASTNAYRYAQACDEGDADSCYYVGIMWQLGAPTGQNVPQNSAEALRLFRYACRKGSEDACSVAENPDSLPVPTGF